MNKEIEIYNGLLTNIKNRVRQGQLKVNIAANAEMLSIYWDIGRMIHLQQQQKGWGKGVIPKLAKDLKNELSEIKWFSERNLKFMVQFFVEYKNDILIGKLSVSQLKDSAIWQLPVSEYELTKMLPENLKSSLTSIEEIEKELLNTKDTEVAE